MYVVHGDGDRANVAMSEEETIIGPANGDHSTKTCTYTNTHTKPYLVTEAYSPRSSGRHTNLDGKFVFSPRSYIVFVVDLRFALRGYSAVPSVVHKNCDSFIQDQTDLAGINQYVITSNHSVFFGIAKRGVVLVVQQCALFGASIRARVHTTFDEHH